MEKEPAGRPKWVFRTPPEKWIVDCVRPVRHRQAKLMAWGCFWGRQRGPLVPLMHGSASACVCRELLRRWLIPVLEDVRAALGSPLFQQHNAKIHTAQIMLSFFERYAIPHAKVTLRTPPTLIRSCMPRPYSSDKLLADYPDIGDYPGGPEKVTMKLAEVLPRC